MHRKSLTIALCMMASVAAAQSAGGSLSAAVPQAPQLIHASLATGPAAPGSGRAREAADTPQAHAAATSPAGQQAEEDASGGTALPMLLAALALMTGIALRRWGGGAP